MILTLSVLIAFVVSILSTIIFIIKTETGNGGGGIGEIVEFIFIFPILFFPLVILFNAILKDYYYKNAKKVNNVNSVNARESAKENPLHVIILILIGLFILFFIIYAVMNRQIGNLVPSL